MRKLPSPFGLKSPFRNDGVRWLTDYSEDLLNPVAPEISFESSKALDGEWRFRASAAYPPFIGPDIASGTFPIVAGLNSGVAIDLSAYPDDTGRLFIAGQDGNSRYSNWLRSSEFTVPGVPASDIVILDTGTFSSVAGGPDYTFSGQTVADGTVVIGLVHYNGGTARTTNYVRLNGVDMTRIGTEQTVSAGIAVSHWRLTGVTAGTYDITVQTNLGVSNIRGRHWSLAQADIANAVARQQVGSSVSSRSVSGDIAAGGLILATVGSTNTFTDIEFTGIAERAAFASSSSLGRLWGDALFPSAVVGQSVVATGTGGPSGMVLQAIYIPPVP